MNTQSTQPVNKLQPSPAGLDEKKTKKLKTAAHLKRRSSAK